MADLLPCPFCGATPHHGLTKVEYCQLHGDPIQRYRIRCPHQCAQITGPNREQASKTWNTRSPAVIVEPETGSSLADETK